MKPSTLTRALALATAAGTLAITALRPPVSLAAPAPQNWNYAGELAAGRTLHVTGLNGSIIVSRAAGNRVEVKAVKTAKRDDPALVRIVSTQDSDGLHICAIYPGQDSPCERASGKREHHRDLDVQVRFDVALPAGVNLDASTINGDVRARGLTGTLQARTVNGACEVETDGSGEAATVNGSVNASIGHVDRGARLAFSSVNGTVTLSLPPTIDADVEGSTVNGSVQNDFSAATTGQWNHFHTATTLGKGGAHVSASTVNGSVHVRRAVAN